MTNTSKITNSRTVNQLQYDCDGPYREMVTYEDTTCPKCGKVETHKFYLENGAGWICQTCGNEYIIRR